MARKRTKSQPRAYQLKVTIRDIRPPVWRRIRVVGSITFYRLHQIIQNIFAWEDYHLHEFIVDGVHYGAPEDDEEMGPDYEHRDETRFTLGRVIKTERTKFEYVYDYGDNWRHEILVEKIENAESGEDKPVCLTGRRNAPPEDCGGPWGYMEYVNAMRDPSHERHEELTEWRGPGFDAEEFSREEVNRALSVDRPTRDHGVEWLQ